MIKHTLALAAVLALLLPVAAQSATTVYSFNLSGAQEVPANTSPAAGSFQLMVDDVANTLSFVMTAFNLQGAVSGAHIHAAPMGTNGGVVFNLVSNADVISNPIMFGPFPVPNSYGLLGNNKAVAPTLVAAINAMPWNYYVNLHTRPSFVGGEIRGQLAPVPEAGTYAMMALGLGVLGMFARRRRTA